MRFRQWRQGMPHHVAGDDAAFAHDRFCGAEPALPAEPVAPAPSRATREAMWRHAGLERDAEGLEPLLSDPHPLARFVAVSALSRRESRGAHTRSDHPETAPGLDRRHTIVDPGETSPYTTDWV